MRGDIGKLRTPCYVIDQGLLRERLEVLAGVQSRTGCKILLALKGFATWSVFDMVSEYLSGAAASSLFEAELAHEHIRGEVHMCAPGFRDDEFARIGQIVDHIVFNSFSMWERFKTQVQKSKRDIHCGLRINPRHSEVETKIYDPCAAGSRLGICVEDFAGKDLAGITGLHFHTLCEENSDALERTLEAVERQFGDLLRKMEWVNMGGGHQITRGDYDLDLLCRLIERVRERYGVDVYMEPGEAVALDAGFLVSRVLDIVHNEVDIAILDTSASAHMPDVLEMPYRPPIEGADEPGEKAHTYRLAGMTCLSGDVIGDYSFDRPLEVGNRLVFGDMAHYTMVKNTMFNGVNLPDIVLYDPDKDAFHLQRRFEYEDYRGRLS